MSRKVLKTDHLKCQIWTNLCQSDPPENCHMNVKNLTFLSKKFPKTWFFLFFELPHFAKFFSKKLPKIFFFFKIAHGNFFEFFKKFLAIFLKFLALLTFRWQFSRGSGANVVLFGLSLAPLTCYHHLFLRKPNQFSCLNNVVGIQAAHKVWIHDKIF